MTCRKTHSIKINESTFTVDGFPYMQQDGTIVRCAQAALTTIANYYDINKTGPDFTLELHLQSELANRAVPSHGLTSRQIGLGITAMSKHPDLRVFRGETARERLEYRIEELVYNYIESGIPVLLGIHTANEAHAIVVIGHTFTPDSWMTEGEEVYYKFPKSGSSASWVRRFLVQDDNFGPYTLVPIEALRSVCFLAAAPLPPHIYVDSQMIMLLAKHLLDANGINLIEFIYSQSPKDIHFSEEISFWKDNLLRKSRKDCLVLRPILMKWEQYLESKATCAAKEQYETVSSLLAKCAYVWSVEISWPEIFCHPRRCVGELIVDSSTILNESTPLPEQAWILLKVPGLIAYHNLQDNAKGFISVPSDPCICEHFNANATT